MTVTRGASAAQQKKVSVRPGIACEERGADRADASFTAGGPREGPRRVGVRRAAFQLIHLGAQAVSSRQRGRGCCGSFLPASSFHIIAPCRGGRRGQPGL